MHRASRAACRKEVQGGYLCVGHCALLPLATSMAGALLGIVREHLASFPDTHVHVLSSASELLNLAKTYLDVQIRQELLQCAKVSVFVQAMQAYHSESRTKHFMTQGRKVL